MKGKFWFMRLFLIIAVLSSYFLPAAIHAQVLRGIVLEDSTRVPISGATIHLIASSGARVNANTNSAGVFALATSATGTFTIRLTHPSYAQVDSDTLVIATGETVFVELRMARDAIPLEPLVVTASNAARLGGFFERQREAGFGRYLTRNDIQQRGGVSTSDLLLGIPNLDVVRVRRGASASTANVITLRSGTRQCEPAIFIDGIFVRQFPGTSIDDFLTPTMIEGVEVYTSTAGLPPQFMRPDMCGAVAFWTRVDPDSGKRIPFRLAVVGGIMALTLFLGSAFSQ